MYLPLIWEDGYLTYHKVWQTEMQIVCQDFRFGITRTVCSSCKGRNSRNQKCQYLYTGKYQKMKKQSILPASTNLAMVCVSVGC